MPNAEIRELNTAMRAIVVLDGPWLRCRQCPQEGGAFWGAFRDDAFIAAKWNKHADKAHAPAKAGAEAKRDVIFAPKPLRKPQLPAPRRQPNTDDVVRAALDNAVDPDALLDQAIRDLEIGLAA